jgi:DNA-binding XRE family transcriptional regulator
MMGNLSIYGRLGVMTDPPIKDSKGDYIVYATPQQRKAWALTGQRDALPVDLDVPGRVELAVPEDTRLLRFVHANPTAFGAYLKRRRIECGLTQDELSLVLGVARPSISALETGVYQPSLTTLRKCREVFGITIDDLRVEIAMDDEQAVAA